MNHFLYKRNLRLDEINRRMRDDAAGYIAEETDRYHREVGTLARFLASNFSGHRLVMLSGPSSSGKTTTALTLKHYLEQLGTEAHTVSMDDFYRGRNRAPMLPDGTYDYESIEALRLDKLEECMQALLRDGVTLLPRFDFRTGEPSEKTEELRLGKNAVVIFEGIHAINPYFEQHLPGDCVYKLFINAFTPIYDGMDKLMARRDVRLTRRILRDERFRSSPVGNTLSMWPQVIRGENKYMFPYADTVDYMVDTTHGFESCVFAPLLTPALEKADAETMAVHGTLVRRLMEALERFEPCSVSMLPENSLLREFVGAED